jgi:uncharacterized OsmC-like protein
MRAGGTAFVLRCFQPVAIRGGKPMSDIQSHRVSIELTKGYQFLVHFDDVENTPALRCDEPEPLGNGEGPSPAAILGAAVGTCLATSLTFCLRRARLEPSQLTARVVTHIARNERGRLRVTGIDVELDSEFDADLSGRKRCDQLFEDFCTVTASIRDGIPVHVALRDRAKSAA